MEPRTTVETSDDVHNAQLIDRMLGQALRQRGGDAAPLVERARCGRPDADVIRMTSMAVAARCSRSF